MLGLTRPNPTLYLGVYCDDTVAVYGRSDKGSVYSDFRDHLHTKWKAEDEGELNDILNVRVSRVGSDVILDQAAYIDAMVERFMPAGKLGSFKNTRRRSRLILFAISTPPSPCRLLALPATFHPMLLFLPPTSQ